MIRVALRFQRADARPMLVPLMFPEILVISFVVLPIYIHVVQQARSSGLTYDGRNIGIFTGWITIGLVSAIAIIRPWSISV